MAIVSDISEHPEEDKENESLFYEHVGMANALYHCADVRRESTAKSRYGADSHCTIGNFSGSY